jgi:hypothetical protein
MRAVIDPALDPTAVPAPSDDAAAFHPALSRYAPTPVHQLDAIASELGVGAVEVKDESSRLGLTAFKILGASRAVELSAKGLTTGKSGAAPLAGLRALQNDEDCRGLREHLGVNRQTRVLLIASEGTTGSHAR